MIDNFNIDINYKDEPYQHAALDYAISNNFKILVILLLKHGADVNTKSIHNETPLHIASILGYSYIIKLLIKAGADINAESTNGKTPLYWAITNDSHNHKKSTKLLIESGAR